MVVPKRIILAVVMAVAATATVRADMIPVSGLAIGCLSRSCECPEVQRSGHPEVQPFVAVVLKLLPPGLPPVVPPSGEARSESRPVTILSDDQNSLSLCLYALFSLGLCKSAPWVKKLSLDVIPGWYHDGGPFQVGHSLAVSPDCCCSAMACLIQPDDRVHNPLPQYRGETRISLWRKSQLTLAALASRAPPSQCLLRWS